MSKLLLFDKGGVLKEVLTPLKAIHTHEINAENTLQLETTSTVNKLDSILYQDEMLKWHEYVVKGVEDLKYYSVIYAEHSSYELYQAVVKDKRPNSSPSVHLSDILAGTRWSVGNVELGEPLSKTYYYLSVYESIMSLVSSAGGEVRFRIEANATGITGRYVDILTRIGYDTGKRFEYGSDVVEMTRKVLDDDIYTALIGRGKGEEIGDGYGRRITLSEVNYPDSPIGVEYVFDQEAFEEWGILLPNGTRQHRIGQTTFDDVEDVEELYLKTKEALQTNLEPKVNYEIEVTILNDLYENVTVGDSVKVIDKNFNGRELRLDARVIRLERDILYRTSSVVTLGKIRDNMSIKQKETDEVLDNFRAKSGVWDRSGAFGTDGKLQASYIKNLLEQWNELANVSGGWTYILPGQGTVTYNAPLEEDPTEVVQIVGGTIRIANSKLPNGEWDWRTVMTAEGIAGQEILANTITANQLRSDAGSNLDLSSNESIRLAVSNIQVGGRNLLLLSDAQTTLSGIRWSDYTGKKWSEI